MVLARICVSVKNDGLASSMVSCCVWRCVVFLWVVSCCVVSCCVILCGLYCVLLLSVLSVNLPGACCSNWVAFSVIVLVFYVSN